MAEVENKTIGEVGVQTDSFQNRAEDLVENTGDFVKNNQNVILGVAGAIVLGVGALVGYKAYQDSQNVEAQGRMFQAVYYFEQDSLKKAINGDGNQDGFLRIADDYGSTKSGKLAHYYLGAAYLKQGKFQEAVEELDDFSSDDILVQGRAYALLGDAYSELNQFSDAEAAYTKAANYKPNRFFTPGYLIKLAAVQEAQKNYSAAANTYDRIIQNYFDSQEASEARKYKARAEALGSNS